MSDSWNPSREEVIEGLKKVWDAFDHMEHELYADYVFDALKMLKDNEPRVLTLEEVKAFGWDYCYLEEERLPGKEYRMVCGDYALACITWPCVASMRIQHGDNNYGKNWRCWSARPTDEQREAVPWTE